MRVTAETKAATRKRILDSARRLFAEKGFEPTTTRDIAQAIHAHPTYMEALAFQIKKPGTATPGTTVQESRVGSKPGETPAGAIGREVTVTATITAINKKAETVTIKGPRGNTETIKAKDPKNLDLVKVGDLVEITYAQALAVSLDKPAKK